MDTGMLDMSAFGDFGGFGGADDDDGWDDQPVASSHSQQQQQQQQLSEQQGSGRAPATAAAAAAAPGTGANSSSAMETGMLDMSAFGGFGDFGGMDDPEPDQQQQQQQASAADALATGMLDMSAFGFGGDMGDESPASAQQQQQQRAQADSSAQLEVQEAANVDLPTRLVKGLPPQLLAKTLVQFPPAPKKTLAKPGVVGLSGSLATAAAAAGGAAAAPQQQLLSRAEVRELHAVMGLSEARKQLAAGHSSSSGSGGAGGSAQAYYSRLLGAAGAADDTGRSGYARNSSSSKGAGAEGSASAAADAAAGRQQQQEGDAEVLTLLGLNPSQGQQLCNIAAALSTRTFMGQEGAAADEADYGGVASSGIGIMSSAGPANAAALAASWASSPADSSSYNSISRRWPGLSRSSSSNIGAAAAGSNDAAASLAIIAAPDAGFSAALFQELDSAGRLFAVSVQAALLQLASHVAAAPAATALSGQQERERRFSTAVARLFQPVSVSRNQAAQGRKGAALLAHYPAMPMPVSGGAGGADAAGSSRSAGLRPPLSPSRQQQQHGSRGPSGGGLGGGAHQGFRLSANGLGFSRSGSRSGMAMRSSMSVVSMLSFSSLKNDGSSIDGGSEGGAVAAAVAAAVQAGSSSWAAFMGLLPGVTPLLCLWALSSSSQAPVLQVLLPLVPDGTEGQLAAAGVGAAAVAAEHGHHHSHRQGGGAAGGSFAAAGGQEQQGV
jgi:hypothetical protein